MSFVGHNTIGISAPPISGEENDRTGGQNEQKK